MDNFYELSEDTISKFFEVFNKKTPKFQFIIGKDLLISINEDILNVFDDESVTILLEQEIDKINMNIETGKIKLVRTDLNTFSSLVNKYGVEKVARANKVEELYKEQQKDAKKDEEFIA